MSAARGPARIVLASRSPQRRQLLETLGVSFLLRATDVAELTSGDPAEVAAENALRKARAAATRHPEDRLPVLGVDTLVAVDGTIYGKPADEAAAGATLRALSGRRHTVLSGVAVLGLGDEPERRALALTTVRFRHLDEAAVAWYLASGEWRQRAGGYAIQGRGMALVEAIDGEYANVVGLPVAVLLRLWPQLLAKGT